LDSRSISANTHIEMNLVDLEPAGYAICMITVAAWKSNQLLPALIGSFADHTSAGKSHICQRFKS
jgi:hypothetical protein